MVETHIVVWSVVPQSAAAVSAGPHFSAVKSYCHDFVQQ